MARKSQISFVCQECGYDSPAYMGKCPECGMWNTFRQITVNKQPTTNNSFLGNSVNTDSIIPKTLSQISYTENQRIKSGFSEMDMVLGGGIVNGSATLLAGDPGIGKSTLLLQLALNISNSKVVLSEEKDPLQQQKKDGKQILRDAQNDKRKVLYISGEESMEQIKMRAERLTNNKQLTTNDKKKTRETNGLKGKDNDNFLLISLSDVDAAVAQVQNQKPDLVVVDSIQTMQSENAGGLSGSVGQVRYCALVLIKAAKTLNIPVIIVGHVTKEGMVAGPMVLSHMVDTVLFLEGEKFTPTRILRSLKNRFGPVDEVGIFQMDESGMQEVTNPEQLFLNPATDSGQVDVPGSVLVSTLEGTRSFLVELQSLVVYSKLPMPRRVVSGVDGRRVELLLAVLQKHARLPLETYDVFVNVAGGLKVNDPGIDLGICLAVYSSLKNIPLKKVVGIAEVGLLGELRNVSGIDKRIREAEKMGYKKIITAKKYRNLKSVLEVLEK